MQRGARRLVGTVVLARKMLDALSLSLVLGILLFGALVRQKVGKGLGGVARDAVQVLADRELLLLAQRRLRSL